MVSRAKRAGIAVAGVAIAWLIALLVIGWVYGERYADGVADRLSESLHGSSVVGGHDLAMVRGRLTLDHLQVDRDDTVGKLRLDVGSVRCELLPLGGALFDRTCRVLAIEDLQLDLSTFAVFQLRKPKRPPIHASSVVIDHAVMVLSPTAVAPSLGRMRLVIDHAEAGDTVFKTPLSWLFSLDVLRATLELPIGAIRIEYGQGMLSASGSFLGSHPVALPYPLPVADLADDPPAEMKRLVAVGRELAEKLVAQKTRQWLRSKL